MEGLIALLGCLLALCFLVSPIVSFINMRRLRRLNDEIENLKRHIDQIRSELGRREKESESARAMPEAPAVAPPVVPSPGITPVVPPPVIESKPPLSDMLIEQPAISDSKPEELKEPQSFIPKPTRPAMPRIPEHLTSASSEQFPPPKAETPPAQETPSLKPKFDWEALLGVRAMAWVGAVALAIAGILFAKYAIDRGFFTPEMRFATLMIVGVGALLGAEFVLRKGYEVTCNALCGAGVAILYSGLFAGHALYGLIGVWPTFALMALVTCVAGLMSIRYNAVFIAILGLLGGFATPLLLSTGEDRPFGLFGYILLLNIGLLWVAVRKGWNVLALLGLAGTFLIEALWTWRFLSPEKILIGLGAYTIFSALYLALPRIAGNDAQRQTLARASLLGGIAPFIFAFYIAGSSRFASSWPLLFGFMALLDAALVWVALRRAQPYLVLSGAIATSVAAILWSLHGLNLHNYWGAGLAAVGLTLLLNADQRVASWLKLQPEETDRRLLDAAGLIACAGLLLFMLIFILKGLGQPPWCFLCLVTGLGLLVFERSRPHSQESFETGVALVGPLLIALILQFWFFNATRADVLELHLAVPVLFGVVWSIIIGSRMALMARPSGTGLPSLSLKHEDGSVTAIVAAIIGLAFILTQPSLRPSIGPLFAALGVLSILLVITAIRSPRTPVLLLGVSSAGALAFVYWRLGYFAERDWVKVLSILGTFYLAWLALPFVISWRFAPHWQREPWPWLASALSGPLFFFVIYKAFVVGFGKSFIGILPVGMAALSLASLAKVRHLFVPADDPVLAKQRLRNLALYAAIALGFISVAIPLQLDRQWITIGWALEGLAVWWLYRRLPHPGLKYFGFALFVVVNLRLLVNRNVLYYEPRGFPIFNWLLYTYGIAAACCIIAAALLHPVERQRLTEKEASFFQYFGLSPIVGFLGLLLIFALINLEIADYFSPGNTISIDWKHSYARDVTTSLAWGLYGIVLLVIGMWRKMRALRFISLGFIILTIVKVFMWDLSSLAGLYRVLSFLGLAFSLIVVSLLYQRFVFRKGMGDELSPS